MLLLGALHWRSLGLARKQDPQQASIAAQHHRESNREGRAVRVCDRDFLIQRMNEKELPQKKKKKKRPVLTESNEREGSRRTRKKRGETGEEEEKVRRIKNTTQKQTT